MFLTHTHTHTHIKIKNKTRSTNILKKKKNFIFGHLETNLSIGSRPQTAVALCILATSRKPIIIKRGQGPVLWRWKPSDANDNHHQTTWRRPLHHFPANKTRQRHHGNTPTSAEHRRFLPLALNQSRETRSSLRPWPTFNSTKKIRQTESVQPEVSPT